MYNFHFVSEFCLLSFLSQILNLLIVQTALAHVQMVYQVVVTCFSWNESNRWRTERKSGVFGQGRMHYKWHECGAHIVFEVFWCNVKWFKICCSQLHTSHHGAIEIWCRAVRKESRRAASLQKPCHKSNFGSNWGAWHGAVTECDKAPLECFKTRNW